jgi:sigma-B regulation protein RsbU (phosphoserine phosphatase)
MADVTSHGVGAAMVMAILRSNLRTSAVRYGSNADKVLKEINPLIHRDTPSNMYASVFYGVFNHTSKELYYAMAGHEPGLIYNLKDGKNKEDERGRNPVGTANGMLFDPLIELSKVTLKSGDILIQYTDGVTEGKNQADELFGEQRFYAPSSRTLRKTSRR